MKKIIVLAALGLGVYSSQAQTKVAYINSEELISVMPEAEKADAELKQYQAELAQIGQDLMKELNEKDSMFVRDSLKYSSTMKEIKKNELVTLYQKVQNWNQEAQERYQAKAQEKIAPIRTKALETVRAVAKEKKYDYVLDQNAVIVGPPGDDLLPFVKEKMGIKAAAPAPGKKP
jgi:outer membrane protein